MRHFLLAALFAAAAVVACGSEDTRSVTGAESAADAGGAEWAPGNHGGRLFLRYANGKLGVDAFFHVLPSGGTCSTTTSGLCVVTSCTIPPTDDGGRESTVSDPAGKITVTGGALPAGYGVDYASGYPYVETPVTAAPWRLGDAITFGATGEWVMPFTATLAAPAPGATLSAPVLGASPLAIDRAKPLPVAWSGAAGGKLDVVVANADTTRAFGAATCTFDAAAGSGEIPAAVLAKMAPGAGTFVASPSSRSTVTSGQYTFTVGIQSGAASGSGAVAFL